MNHNKYIFKTNLFVYPWSVGHDTHSVGCDDSQEALEYISKLGPIFAAIAMASGGSDNRWVLDEVSGLAKA